VSDFVDNYLSEITQIIEALDRTKIEAIANGFADVRVQGGRLLILGVGGSAGHASHAVNDFRKICGFEAYAPTDNVSKLTAHTNDEGWNTVFVEWRKGSRLKSSDGILVFSVGGGNKEKNILANLVHAVELADDVSAAVYRIVGSDKGYTAQAANACVVVAPLVAERITPYREGIAAVIWHLLVSHPALKTADTKWESVK